MAKGSIRTTQVSLVQNHCEKKTQIQLYCYDFKNAISLRHSHFLATSFDSMMVILGATHFFLAVLDYWFVN